MTRPISDASSGKPRNIGRLASTTWDLSLPSMADKYQLTLGFRPDGTLHEVAFVSRGKIGSGMDQLLVDLGIQISRAIQGRNPSTGEVIDSTG